MGKNPGGVFLWFHSNVAAVKSFNFLLLDCIFSFFLMGDDEKIPADLAAAQSLELLRTDRLQLLLIGSS